MRKTNQVFRKHSIQKVVLFAIMALSTSGIITYTSCSKTDATADNAKFVGTWYGPGPSDSFMITGGMDDIHISMPIFIIFNGSNYACSKRNTTSWSVSGSNITLASMNVSDSYGNTGTMSGSASLNGDSLSFILISIDAINGTLQVNYTVTKRK
jgi:hypothetical protein